MAGSDRGGRLGRGRSCAEQMNSLGSLKGSAGGGGKGIDALLLTCIDFRLIDDAVRYMDGRGQTDRYDQMILAGASLGVASDKYPAWAETFWQHLDMAVQLHHIRAAIAMHHRDCGAYRLVFGRDFAKDPVAELAIHTAHLTRFRELVKQRHPGLETELLLMALDGSVETVG